MSDDETPGKRTDEGFEYQGRFYPWHVSDMGKDLMLIDRIAGMTVLEFFDIVDDDHERERGPVLLTLIATSIRHANPDWSVERVYRLVLALNLSDVEFLGGDEEEPPAVPPPASTLEAAPPTTEPSRSPPNGSSSSSTPPESSSSETSYATPV